MRKIPKIYNQKLTFKNDYYHVYICEAQYRLQTKKQMEQEEKWIAMHNEIDLDDNLSDWEKEKKRKEVDSLYIYEKFEGDFRESEVIAICTSKYYVNIMRKGYIYERWLTQGYEMEEKLKQSFGETIYLLKKGNKYCHLTIFAEEIKLNDLFEDSIYDDFSDEYIEKIQERMDKDYVWKI